MKKLFLIILVVITAGCYCYQKVPCKGSKYLEPGACDYLNLVEHEWIDGECGHCGLKK